MKENDVAFQIKNYSRHYNEGKDDRRFKELQVVLIKKNHCLSPLLLLFCKLCTMILFCDNEIYKLFYYNFRTNCSLFYEKISLLWTQEISSLNDCEARKLQVPDIVRKTWRETHAPLWDLIGPIIFLPSEKKSFAILIVPIIFFTSKKNIVCLL